jgi:hypothetical protein
MRSVEEAGMWKGRESVPEKGVENIKARNG